MSINKAKLTETDIITKFIMPAISKAGWDDMTQIRQEVKLRDGKVIVCGQIVDSEQQLETVIGAL